MYASRTHTGTAPSRFLILVAVPASAIIHLLLAAAWPGIDLRNEQAAASSLSVAIDLGASYSEISAVAGNQNASDAAAASTPPAPASAEFPPLEPSPVFEASRPETPALAVTEAAAARVAAPQQQNMPTSTAASDQAAAIPVAATPTPAQSAEQPDMEPATDPPPEIMPPPITQPVSMTTQQELAEVIEQLQSTTEASLTEVLEQLTTQPPEGYEISVSQLAESGPTALSSYRVTIQTELGDGLASTELTITERPFSWYAKFINRWDNDVIMANDQIFGRFHSNSPVNLETDWRARPLFAGPVTLATHQSIGRRLRESDIFTDEVETGIGRIDMPDAIVPAVFPGQGSGLQVISYDQYTQLTFLGADGFNWYQPDTQLGGHQALTDDMLIIAGTDDSRFDVSGTIHGQVAIYSPRRITITDDLVYADQSAGANHLLSLTSNGSIEIANPSVTGPGDLIIHGALFARQRFSVRRYNTRAQGRLHIMGTLVAGSISATEPRYTTLVEYDSRFESIRPPAFPTTGLFDMSEWDREWTITAVPDAFPEGADGIARQPADE
ncbi:MAG: hypothetical protein CMQ46_07545 [Gammaproteobacteria bacterium]|nr:hypothetical protein [Gammaproteobacteria bacterium]MBJ55097.1 hypothetical protein [Gammaproteobacteria bacterium]